MPEDDESQYDGCTDSITLKLCEGCPRIAGSEQCKYYRYIMGLEPNKA
jgi:hypothetical protein